MQQVSQKSGPDFQRLWGRWAGLFKPIYGDSRVTRNFICQSENLPLLCVRVCVFLSIIVWESLLQVEQLMDTRAGQYLSSHPFLALNVLLFGAAAALPVGLFLSFALVTLVMSAVGFLCFEGTRTHAQNNVLTLSTYVKCTLFGSSTGLRMNPNCVCLCVCVRQCSCCSQAG